MTQPELQKIRDRCNRATSGPWKSHAEGRDFTGGGSCITTGTDRDIEPIGATADDLDFMAHAQQDIPRLIDEIERLQAKLEERGLR